MLLMVCSKYQTYLCLPTKPGDTWGTYRKSMFRLWL